MDKTMIGKTINEMSISDDKECLIFKTNDGEFVYATMGDCCNSVWIEHIDNVDALLGGTVTEVQEASFGDWVELEEKDFKCEFADEYEELAFWTMITNKGHCKIEVRNNHNGYYGGEVIQCSKIKDDATLKQLTEDF
jgi:hypothetical protein